MAGYTGPIDFNRGVMYCTVPGTNGVFRVFMYLDEPGVYFDMNLGHVPEETAARAGFPTARFKKQKAFLAERTKFEALMRDKLQMSDAVETYKECGDLKLQYYPETGMAFIERAGQRLYPTPIALATAVMIFDDFVKEAETSPAEGRAEDVKAEPEDAKSSEAAPSPPPAAASGPKASGKVLK